MYDIKVPRERFERVERLLSVALWMSHTDRSAALLQVEHTSSVGKGAVLGGLIASSWFSPAHKIMTTNIVKLHNEVLHSSQSLQHVSPMAFLTFIMRLQTIVTIDFTQTLNSLFSYRLKLNQNEYIFM